MRFKMCKKVIFVILSFIIISGILVGCGNADENTEKTNLYEGNINTNVQINDFEVIKEGNNVKAFSFSLENTSDYVYTYGEWNRLEVLQDDAWYVFRSNEAKGFQFKAIASLLGAKEKVSEEYHYLYQKTLPKGYYRFVLSLVPGSHGIEQYVVHEFDVK